jgi:hypothetical protein
VYDLLIGKRIHLQIGRWLDIQHVTRRVQWIHHQRDVDKDALVKVSLDARHRLNPIERFVHTVIGFVQTPGQVQNTGIAWQPYFGQVVEHWPQARLVAFGYYGKIESFPKTYFFKQIISVTLLSLMQAA